MRFPLHCDAPLTGSLAPHRPLSGLSAQAAGTRARGDPCALPGPLTLGRTEALDRLLRPAGHAAPPHSAHSPARLASVAVRSVPQRHRPPGSTPPPRKRGEEGWRLRAGTYRTPSPPQLSPSQLHPSTKRLALTEGPRPQLLSPLLHP